MPPVHNFKIAVMVDPDKPVEPFVEALGAAGCTDALVGTGTPGIIFLDFSRDAADKIDALVTAMRQVQTAIPDPISISVFTSPD